MKYDLYLLEILRKYSDEDHFLKQKDIIDLLLKLYDVRCDRRTVSNNIQALMEFGYVIKQKKGTGYAFVGHPEKDFTDAELRLLIDNILFSQILSRRRSSELIKKLKNHASIYFAKKIKHISQIDDLNYSNNSDVLLSIRVICDAITEQKQICFIANNYGTDFKLHPKRTDARIFNPYQMVFRHGHYFVIGNYDKYDDLINCRIDRMTKVQKLNTPARKLEDLKNISKDFKFSSYLAEHAYMYSGDSIRVKLSAKISSMNDLVDWFGKNFQIVSKDKKNMIISLRCNKQALVYWALQYGDAIEILEPKQFRQELADHIRTLFEKYQK